MFKGLEVISEVLAYQKEWDFFFNSSFQGLDSRVKELNSNRKKIALSGYAPSIFGKMFSKDLDPNVNLVFSVFNLMMGYIDDKIDVLTDFEEKKSVLRDAETFFTRGVGFDELLPLYHFLSNRFSNENILDFLDAVHISGESAIYEAWAKKPADLQHSRKIVGVSYADVLISVIDGFCSNKINSIERKIIQNYAVGCSFLDNLSDVYQDRANGTLTSAVLELENGNFNNFLKQEISRVNREYFKPSRELFKLLPDADCGRFDSIEGLAKTYYVSSFLKKKFSYK
ncbi:hypothetical protein JXM83_00460 [Candidatus Woesearchaeota archaeon]|nr:hypothetical protein [Candidatus Woesearchaeota archaeon]